MNLPVESLGRGYSEEEVSHIYELGRLLLENGDTKRAEIIMHGLTQVKPSFAAAWLALGAIQIMQKHYDRAIISVNNALQQEVHSSEAALFLVTCYLCTGDFNSAGTLLGEIGEKVDSGLIDNPYIVRFYRAQLARFQSR